VKLRIASGLPGTFTRRLRSEMATGGRFGF
jgi:hypothetical protein